MSRHSSHLTSYVKTRRQKGGKPSDHENITRLPDELVSKIFTFLSPSQIMKCAQVSKQWNSVSNEKALWVYHYNLIPRSIRDSILPEERVLSTFHWKMEIIKRTVAQRNKKVKGMLKKLNIYTGLSAGIEQALKFLTIKWKLSFIDKSNKEYSFINDDMFYFASSATVRWCSFEVPRIPKLKQISISALTPVFYHRDWKAHSDSPTKSSLLMTYNMNDLNLSKMNCTSQDDMITLHTVEPGVMLAAWKSSWKDGGEFAFVSACFHYHQLVEKILYGQRESVHRLSAHKPVVDDINPSYGLHRYSATIELRNQRKLFWGYQYRELFQKELTGEYLVLQSDKEHEGFFNVKTCLPWKTPALKNIIKDMVIVDLTLRDENQQTVWCVSSGAKVAEHSKDEVDYTYSDGMQSNLQYQDNIGKLKMEFVWIEQDKQNIVKLLEVYLKKSFINSWFGTKY